MSESFRVEQYLGGPLDGQDVLWQEPVKAVQDIQYALPTGAALWAKYRLFKGKVNGSPFEAYVHNDFGRAEALTLLAEKLIKIDSIG